MQEEFTEPGDMAPAGDPREYAMVLWKHVWMILTVVGVFVASGAYYASKQPAVYQSEAKIVIETESPQILSDVAPVVDTGTQSFWALREYLETQHRILQSTSTANEVALRLGLNNDPVFLGVAEIDDPEE